MGVHLIAAGVPHWRAAILVALISAVAAVVVRGLGPLRRSTKSWWQDVRAARGGSEQQREERRQRIEEGLHLTLLLVAIVVGFGLVSSSVNKRVEMCVGGFGVLAGLYALLAILRGQVIQRRRDLPPGRERRNKRKRRDRLWETARAEAEMYAQIYVLFVGVFAIGLTSQQHATSYVFQGMLVTQVVFLLMSLVDRGRAGWTAGEDGRIRGRSRLDRPPPRLAVVAVVVALVVVLVLVHTTM